MRKRKLRYGRIIIILLLLYVFKTYISGYNISEFMESKLHESDSITDSQQNIDIETNNDFEINDLYSTQAILINLNDDKVLLESGSEEKIYPASLTKIMTAVVVLENISDFKRTISLPESMFSDLYEANASMAGFLPGEKVTAMDLLYGVILPSGADAAIGLAIDISDSEENFVNLMNKKAKQLGMKDTHFANVTGLHDINHYTTVKDISILLEYALENDIFREVFTSDHYSTLPTNLHSGGITLSSTMFKKMDKSDFEGGKILGGKTGYTKEAGLCLASLAEKNGNEYILVTVGAEGNPQTEQYNIIDAFTVYNKYLIE
ncbi:D-alanyl-D-alanine carboxypeptidase [Clostridium sp. D2Q-14]|uniref:D-alanyl-D-alanine carboxypeptidase family protein n=1 Tax=Anaeromonas gelatinilytica TaxID=2683194 RepID=UPI00193B1703|nr:serine hydrolase [Anaeromonas gelatinilytica]MBS4536300.1 D-alanyl-D-alanine carboxypeptidase [Anaeromonas gelatinilytica]